MPSTPHIAAFWRDFAAAEATLQAVPLRERVEQANDLLTPHVQGLALEMQGGPDDAVIELIVTAHGSIENFPLLSQVVAAAPKLVSQLSWLALLVGMVVTMKTYWIALMVRPSVRKTD